MDPFDTLRQGIKRLVQKRMSCEENAPRSPIRNIPITMGGYSEITYDSHVLYPMPYLPARISAVTKQNHALPMPITRPALIPGNEDGIIMSLNN